MTPSYAIKNGNRRYRYYICTRAQKNGRHCCSSGAVPAAEIERFVIEQVQGIEDPGRAGEDADTQASADARPEELASAIRNSVERVDYDGAKGTVTIALRPAGAAPADGPAPSLINERAAPPQAGRTITRAFHFRRRGHGSRKELRPEPKPKLPVPPPGKLPRISRLLALAHRLEALVGAGQVSDAAALARLGRVSRARISQIMSLLNLAPDIQEEILFLPSFTSGRDPLPLGQLLPLTVLLDWHQQRRRWRRLKALQQRSME